MHIKKSGVIINLNNTKRAKKNNILFKISLIMFIVLIVVLIATFGIYFHVTKIGSAYIYDDSESVITKPVAIVFGAGYYENGRLSPILQDRVDTAIELYKKGKVKKILMTGANNTSSYDEPSAMKRYAINKNIPSNDIVLDYAGFRTYDSVYRARDVFLVKSAILVTQRYHLYRAIYIGRKLGLDVVGVQSDKRRYIREDWYETREFLAIILCFVETNITKPHPKFLGEEIPIMD